MTKVQFWSEGTQLAADLYYPPNWQEGEPLFDRHKNSELLFQRMQAAARAPVEYRVLKGANHGDAGKFLFPFNRDGDLTGWAGARCDVPSLAYSFGFDADLQQEWQGLD